MQLYSSIMQGMAVAHAVRAARQELARISLDQTYLFYTVSGDGDVVLSAPARRGRPRPRSPQNQVTSATLK